MTRKHLAQRFWFSWCKQPLAWKNLVDLIFHRKSETTSDGWLFLGSSGGTMRTISLPTVPLPGDGRSRITGDIMEKHSDGLMDSLRRARHFINGSVVAAGDGNNRAGCWRGCAGLLVILLPLRQPLDLVHHYTTQHLPEHIVVSNIKPTTKGRLSFVMYQ